MEKEQSPRPKRPMNPTFLYINEKREAYRNKNPDVRVTEVAKILTQEYKNLSEKQKKKYIDQYEKNKVQYQKDKEVYEAKYGEIKVQRKNKTKEFEFDKQMKEEIIKLNVPDRPKKPMTVYFKYRTDEIQRLKKEDPEMSFSQITEKIKEGYSNLSDKQKKAYEKILEKEQEKYQIEKDKYENKYSEELKKIKKIKNKYKQMIDKVKNGIEVSEDENDNKRKKSVGLKKTKASKKKTLDKKKKNNQFILYIFYQFRYQFIINYFQLIEQKELYYFFQYDLIQPYFFSPYFQHFLFKIISCIKTLKQYNKY